MAVNPYAPPETRDLGERQVIEPGRPELEQRRAGGLSAELRVRLAGVFAMAQGVGTGGLCTLAAAAAASGLGAEARRDGALAVGLGLVTLSGVMGGLDLVRLNPRGRHTLAVGSSAALVGAALLRPLPDAAMLAGASLPLLAATITAYRTRGPLSPYYRDVVVAGSHARPLTTPRGLAGLVAMIGLAGGCTLVAYTALFG